LSRARCGEYDSRGRLIPPATRGALDGNRRIHCNKFHAGIAPAREPVFESADNMLAVRAEGAMIAVVK